MSYHHLNREERGKLALLHNQGKGVRQIAAALQRSPSTISRELRRNKPETGNYRAEAAQRKYKQRRWEPLPWKFQNTQLQAYLAEKLSSYWSPEQVAGRLPLEFPQQPQLRVSHSTIYRWLRQKLLPRTAALRLKLRHHGHRHGEKRGQFHGIRELKERSHEALHRKRMGDWEVDTIVSSERSSRACLLSVCDRKSRYCGLVLLRNKSAAEVQRGFELLFGGNALPLETMTGDRGKEFACYKQVEERWNIPFYFCRPHSPWQKPSVENQNGLVRQFFPKGTNFNQVSEQQVSHVMALLNDRPRKSLGFRSPNEVLHFT